MTLNRSFPLALLGLFLAAGTGAAGHHPGADEAHPARGLPRAGDRMPRLSLAAEDGTQRSRAGHDAHAVRPSRGAGAPPAPKLTEGTWRWAGAVSMTAFAGPWGVSYAANLTPDRTPASAPGPRPSCS